MLNLLSSYRKQSVRTPKEVLRIYETSNYSLSIATGGLFFSHTMNEARAILLLFLNRSSQRKSRPWWTGNFSWSPTLFKYATRCANRILDMYLDSLDPDHSLTLKFKIIKNSMVQILVLHGELNWTVCNSPAISWTLIYEFMLAELKQPQNLKQPILK